MQKSARSYLAAALALITATGNAMAPLTVPTAPPHVAGDAGAAAPTGTEAPRPDA
ncbi:MAG TPA: hypothetical protein VFL67_11620 [Mycobacterium sp.]|nr:hypothetical protein [Mycobacterium sp.]